MAGPRRSSSRRREQRTRRRGELLEASLISLDRSRGPLFKEMEELAASKRGPRAENPHEACTRKFNRMRITDLEAIDIARAFQEKPHLLGKLPQVYARIAKELPYLQDNEEPQPFDCPLLDGKRCMVHHVAKPIACLAWNPGRDYSTDGWHSFSRRDKLNRELFGNEWDLKAIPLQLARFLEATDRTVSGPCGSSLRKKAMLRGEIRARREKAVVDREKREAEQQRRRGRRGAARWQKQDEERKAARTRGESKRPAADGGKKRPSGRSSGPSRPGAPGPRSRRGSGGPKRGPRA